MKNKAHSRSGCRPQRGSTLDMKALLLREMHVGMYPGEALGKVAGNKTMAVRTVRSWLGQRWLAVRTNRGRYWIFRDGSGRMMTRGHWP